MARKIYLQLEFSSGKFFEYSKEESLGFTKHTSTKGNVSYRRYEDRGVTGVLESVGLRDSNFGKQVSLTLKSGEDTIYLPVNIMSQNGNVDSAFCESLIKFLPVMHKGMEYTISAYNFIPENEKYAKQGFSIKQGEEKLKSALTNEYKSKAGEHVPGDIPMLEWVEKLGRKQPSATSLEKKDNFLISILEREAGKDGRLAWVPNSSSTIQPTSTPTEAKPKVMAPNGDFDAIEKAIAEDEDMELPF